MGTKSTFKCNRCGYIVTSSGGHDFGMHAVTDTFICRSCCNIADVCIGEYGSTYTREEILLKRGGSDTGLGFYACPKCGSRDKLVKWDENKKPCPRCKGKMEQDIDGLVLLCD
jgi:hypothetical protein